MQEVEVMSKRIITISREFGAGGHTLGKMVAERLNIPFYDHEIIDRAVADTGFSPDFVREAGEYASTTHSFLFNLLLSHSVTTAPGGELSNYDKIYIAQARTIQDLAEKSPCVIVGRCADYILRERDDCLNVFVHAAKEYRARRVLEEYGEKEGQTVAERLEEKDKKRMLYYKHYTDRDWADINNYHLTINTAVIPLELAASWIADAVR